MDCADVARPTLTRKRGWFLRVVGVLLIASTAAAVIAFMVGALERFHFSLLLGFALGGACFVGAIKSPLGAALRSGREGRGTRSATQLVTATRGDDGRGAADRGEGTRRHAAGGVSVSAPRVHAVLQRVATEPFVAAAIARRRHRHQLP